MMADVYDKQTRSYNMSRIRGKYQNLTHSPLYNR